MEHIKVEINGRTIEVPQSWNDLSKQTQYNCYHYLMMDTGGLFDLHEVLPSKRILLMMELLQIDEAFMDRWKADCIEVYSEEDGEDNWLSEIGDLLSITNFFFEEVQPDKPGDTKRFQMNLGLTKCPYPLMVIPAKSRKRKPKHWFAPADSLSNISIYELGMTFSLFERFMLEKDETAADQLLAILYRPRKPKTKFNKLSAYEGDKRLPLLKYESTVKDRLPYIQRLPEKAKQLIVFWFASCRQEIVEKYPNVFKASDDTEVDKNKYGWGAVLLNLAGGLVDLDKVAKQKHSNALTYLSYLEDERQKQKLKSLVKV